MPTMLVLGATSGIAQATARLFADSGWTLQLAGRDSQRLREVADACGGAPVFPFDALDPASRSALWGLLPSCPDAVLCAVGLLGDQDCACRSPKEALRVMECNFTGLVPVLLQAAEAFEARGAGLIIGLSSVAGDRGRASNYAYGSAKAGFPAFLSGLRYVATGMIAGRRLPSCIVASPERVARDIFRAVHSGRDVLYTPGWWRPLLALYRALPECVAKRLKL